MTMDSLGMMGWPDDDEPLRPEEVLDAEELGRYYEYHGIDWRKRGQALPSVRQDRPDGVSER